jgi:site-specific recombinase XerD
MTTGEALAMGDIVRRGSTWYVRYKDAGGVRRMRASHQPTRELARRYLLEVEGRIARGLVGIPEPAPPALTVAELVERFLGEYTRPRIKDPGNYRKWAAVALGRALPLLGAQAADQVQPEAIARLQAALSRRYAANSVRATLDFLGTVFGWAVRAKLVAQNPVKGVEKPTATASIEYLSRADVQALLARAEKLATAGPLAAQVRYVAVFLVLHTGLRKGELFGLRWRDIDLDARRLTVARSYRAVPKSGKTRQLQLPAAAVPVLAAWQRCCPHTVEGAVIPVVAAKPRMGGQDDLLGLPELLADIGCRPLVHPWHALRHTFASHFVMAGGSLLTLQKILGHSAVKMTMSYAHLAPDFLGHEMDRLKF